MSAQAGMIDLIQEELEAYRRTGRAVHLAHAARALAEFKRQVSSASGKTQVDTRTRG